MVFPKYTATVVFQSRLQGALPGPTVQYECVCVCSPVCTCASVYLHVWEHVHSYTVSVCVCVHVHVDLSVCTLCHVQVWTGVVSTLQWGNNQ